MIGKILDAADKPWFKTMLSVDNDLTGWYASIIAAKNEKKLLILSSFCAINFPE